VGEANRGGKIKGKGGKKITKGGKERVVVKLRRAEDSSVLRSNLRTTSAMSARDVGKSRLCQKLPWVTCNEEGDRYAYKKT